MKTTSNSSRMPRLQAFLGVLVGMVALFQFYLSLGISSTTPTFRLSSIPSPRDITRKQKQHLSQEGLSVIVSVYQQPKCLRQMVQYLRLCPVVQEVRINWFEDPSLLESLPLDYFDIPNSTTSTPVYWDLLPNNISHRFSPYREFNGMDHSNPPLACQATFHVDVDTMYSCRALQFALEAWTRLSKKAVVGFHPRHFKQTGYYQFAESYQTPFRYNTIFVTKGAVMHRDLLKVFFQDAYKPWRQGVDALVTGEDLLMSMMLLATRVETVALCVDPQDTCSVTCRQGSETTTLAQRTADARPLLLQDLWNEFLGNTTPVVKATADQMIWINATVQSWNHRCYSAPANQHSISVANRKCKWFCRNTPVCPQNPKRRTTGESYWQD